MANESFANTLLVEVDGAALPADVAALLSYAYVDDSRNLPDMFLLRFRDPQHLVLAKARFAIGAAVTLKVQTADPGGPQPLMSGEVTAVELDLDPTGTITQVRGLDPGHRLFRGRRVAAYPNMTVADVVRKVAERAGLKVGTIEATPGVGGQRDTQLSQDNLSDWQFLSRLADLVGAQLDVVDGALDFRVPAPPAGAPDPGAKASTDPLVLEAHRNLVSLRATVSAAEQVPSVQARGWDFEHKEPVSATATPRTAGVEVPGVEPAKLAGTFSGPPFLAADPSWHTPGVVQAAAGAVAGQLGEGCVELEGVAKGNPRLRAGTAVALANVGEPFAGRYTLTSTRHLFSEQAGYTTAFVVSGRQERSLYGLSTARAEPARPVGGLLPAIVSDVRDPLRLGRVRLTFPWLDKDFTSGWARTVQYGAGKGRGGVVLPEVGDEVLVGVAGDLDSLYVFGGLYNGKDAMPATSSDPVDATSGEIATRAFVSRTGHTVELDENEGIHIATGDGAMSVRLDTTRGVVEITGRRGVTIDAGTGALQLKGQRVAVTAMSEAELTANGQVTVRGALIRLN